MNKQLLAPQYIEQYWVFIKNIGITPGMEEYEKRKMSIFNQLNFLGLLTGIAFMCIGIAITDHLPPLAWFGAGAPLAISLFVLWLNYERYYEWSRLLYFSLYPVATCLVFLGKVNVGIELFFILYCVLSVFFLQRLINIIFSFALSVACYFVAVVLFHDYYFRLETVSYWFFIFNQLLAFGLIFYALFLVKQENTGYQFGLLQKGRELHKRNLEVEAQRREIEEKAVLLETQTHELTELNNVKNKLFSVIAHDLKTPMYALRNMFQNMQRYKVPANEMEEMLPSIVDEMNYVTGLMENLLQWAKSQMQQDVVHPEVLNMEVMVAEVFGLLHLQATNKDITLQTAITEPVYCFADREMVKLVLRNLISNAIKFTPQKGTITISASQAIGSQVKICVKDNGIGMNEKRVSQLFGNQFVTTNGTDNESGTGIGLKLCKEFIEKNDGEILVQSAPGKGSVFSFTLPRYVAMDN
ncbi:MAG: HAMP domain-containing sensor histidine kinase [Chitinophagaceae bacterium]